MRSICFILQNDYEFDPRVRRKAEALASSGYAVDVLALRASNGLKSYTLNGVHVETVPLGKKRGSPARYAFEYAAFLLWAFVRVHILMRRKRYSVIDVNTLPDFLIFAPLFTRVLGAKLLLDMHEITPEFYISKYRAGRHSLAVRLLTFIERVSFDFADHVVTINEPILDLLVSRGLDRGKATVIMNSADETLFADVALRPERRDRNGATFTMIYHGTLTRLYGLDIAIEAFYLARKDMPGAQLWILGSGPEREGLAALVRRRRLEASVTLVGRVPGAEIPGWLAASDAGILPIRSDVFLQYAFPNKLPEFIVSGKPVIVSRLRGICHYFGENALAYVTPNDPADLASQMVRLYSDHELRERLAATMLQQYAPIRWEVMRKRYVDLIEVLASHQRDAPSPSAYSRI